MFSQNLTLLEPTKSFRLELVSFPLKRNPILSVPRSRVFGDFRVVSLGFPTIDADHPTLLLPSGHMGVIITAASTRHQALIFAYAKVPYDKAFINAFTYSSSYGRCLALLKSSMALCPIWITAYTPRSGGDVDNTWVCHTCQEGPVLTNRFGWIPGFLWG